MFRLTPIASAFAVAGLLVCGHAEAAQRTFVASFGSDANTCSFVSPCRSFTAAHAVTDPNGEIIALDAAGYGAITITKSISIIANPGFYAGIAASTGNAVTIATGGVNVTLRGLIINGIGATNGILVTNGASLMVENCVISNFSNDGMLVQAPVSLRVVNTMVRNNGQSGIEMWDGVTADILNTKVLANGYVGVWAFPQVAGPITVSVSDSVSSENHWGFYSSSTGSKMTITRSTASNNVQDGIGADGVVSVSASLASGNTVGFNNAGGTFESQGNNLVRQNTTNTSGVITNVGGT
jgi:hypothetical protein